MNSVNEPIFFDACLYLLYVLIPLIPAIIIYKIFPDTKVGAQGLLGQLKINATGAFAAYLIVIVAGYSITKNIQQLINQKAAANTTWFVESQVKFLEKNGNEFVDCKRITDDSVRMKLDARSTTACNQQNLSIVRFPVNYEKGISSAIFTYPGFESITISLDQQPAKFDFENRTIDLGIIKLTEAKQQYNQSSVQANPENEFASTPNFNQ